MKVGIDKKICFEWLELAAFNFIETRDAKETRKMLDIQIEPILKGSESRRKVITILKGIWLDIDKEYIDLRDRALDIMPSLNRNERLLMQWGMIMVTYPFFKDLNSYIGRLLSIQEYFTLEQIYSRIVEKYGEKGTLKYAVQRAISGIEEWGVLSRGDKKGIYNLSNKKIKIDNEDLILWFMEACIRTTENNRLQFDNLFNMPSLYPFDIAFNVDIVKKSDYICINRLGVNIDVVELCN